MHLCRWRWLLGSYVICRYSCKIYLQFVFPCIFFLIAMKCANLVNWSTTTKILSFPSDRGNPSMKSIDISSHFRFGMCKGWSNLGVKIFFSFVPMEFVTFYHIMLDIFLHPLLEKWSSCIIVRFEESHVSCNWWIVGFLHYFGLEFRVWVK